MINLWQKHAKSNVWLWYGFDRVLVGLLCALPALTFGAQAGTWEQFESRCLERYEHVFAADLRGLELASIEDGVETWTDGDVTLRRAVSGGPHLSFCQIVGEIEEGPLAEWLASVEGQYFDVSPDAAYAPEVWQSTTWREPRIEVVVIRHAEQSLMVTETDLES